MPRTNRTVRRKFVGRRYLHLPPGDHVSHFDSTKHDACTPEILEPEHEAGTPLDRAVAR
jgi:hypothetical protein